MVAGSIPVAGRMIPNPLSLIAPDTGILDVGWAGRIIGKHETELRTKRVDWHRNCAQS